MILPNSISLKKEGQYCIHCFLPTVERIYRDAKTYYQCASCRTVAERSLVVDNGIVWWAGHDRVYWHESVGILALDEKKRILTILRKIFPFAYALPAGHLDIGEKPEVAALRELHEETGLSNSVLRPVAQFDLHGDSCRRGSDDHRWHLFAAMISSKTPIQLNNEVASVEWLDRDTLLAKSNITFPLRHILETYGAKFFL